MTTTHEGEKYSDIFVPADISTFCFLVIQSWYLLLVFDIVAFQSRSFSLQCRDALPAGFLPRRNETGDMQTGVKA